MQGERETSLPRRQQLEERQGKHRVARQSMRGGGRPPATMPPSPRRVGSSPACAAAPLGSAVWIITPSDTLRARATGSGAGWKPREARCTAPRLMSCGTTRRTVLLGMAKPRPADVPALPRRKGVVAREASGHQRRAGSGPVGARQPRSETADKTACQ